MPVRLDDDDVSLDIEQQLIWMITEDNSDKTGGRNKDNA
jgi:hypothetical protein